MIVYHGSGQIVKSPELRTARFTKDFGVGFYCTNLREQAVKWTVKFSNHIVNTYRCDLDDNLNILEFKTMTEEWLDFVVDCRNGKSHNYDIVIGAMADDQIYNFITEYIEGHISKEAFWALAKFNYPTHQIAFCSDKALKCLKYIESEEVLK